MQMYAPPRQSSERGGSNKESPSQATPHQLFRGAALAFPTAAATAPATAPPAPRRHRRPSRNPLRWPPKKQPAFAHAPAQKSGKRGRGSLRKLSAHWKRRLQGGSCSFRHLESGPWNRKRSCRDRKGEEKKWRDAYFCVQEPSSRFKNDHKDLFKINT